MPNCIIATATKIKQNFGSYLSQVRKCPVIVNKNGKNVAVLLSPDNYDILTDMERKYFASDIKK